MLSLFGFAVSPGAMLSPGGLDLEAVFMYGLVALLIGMIAWSKYKEPPLSNPYPQGRPGEAIPRTASHADLGPVVAAPVVAAPVAGREQP